MVDVDCQVGSVEAAHADVDDSFLDVAIPRVVWDLDVGLICCGDLG